MIELAARNGGQRRQITKSGYSSARAAAEARAEIIRQEQQGMLPTDGKMTVATWLQRWLVTQEELRDLREGTIIDYQRHITLYWIPAIGHLKLVDLRPQHVTDTLIAIRKDRDRAIAHAKATNATRIAAAAKADETRKTRGLKRPVKATTIRVPRNIGASTTRLIHATLRAALNAAVRAQEIPRNVATLAELPRVQRPKVRPWEPEQLGAWLDSIAGERLYPLYHLAAFGGMRRGELCGLGWNDLDLDRARLTVRWQITNISYYRARAAERAGGHDTYRVRPKTRDGEDRILDLDDTTVDVLRAWRKVQIAERLAWGPGYRNPDNLVFTRENGAPVDPSTVTATFKRLVAQAAERDVPLHHLRHGSASLQLAAGVDIAIVSKRLGHSTITLTSDTYTHLIGHGGKQAAEAAANLVPRQRNAS